MFIAMNRFKVVKGQETAFEEIWRTRRSRLNQMPGFLAFHLLRGPERDDHTLYSSHSSWSSRDAFVAWTKSEHFRETHRGVGGHNGMYLGPPELEMFDAVVSEENPARLQRA